VHLFDTMSLGHFEHLLVEIEAGARGAQCTKSLKPRQVQPIQKSSCYCTCMSFLLEQSFSSNLYLNWVKVNCFNLLY
jgi:hypothetical protein